MDIYQISCSLRINAGLRRFSLHLGKRHLDSSTGLSQGDRCKVRPCLGLSEPPHRSDLKLYFPFTELNDEAEWKRLGGGEFGNVFAGERLGQRVCIKKFKPGGQLDSQLSEFALVNELGREKVVQELANFAVFATAFSVTPQVPPEFVVTLPYADGTFEDILSTCTADELLAILRDISFAMKELHRFKLLHRDLAARNILLQKRGDGSWIAKVCDFGLSCLESTQFLPSRAPVGIWPPETMRSPDYSYPFRTFGDVWSFGLLIASVYRRGRDSDAHVDHRWLLSNDHITKEPLSSLDTNKLVVDIEACATRVVSEAVNAAGTDATIPSLSGLDYRFLDHSQTPTSLYRQSKSPYFISKYAGMPSKPLTDLEENGIDEGAAAAAAAPVAQPATAAAAAADSGSPDFYLPPDDAGDKSLLAWRDETTWRLLLSVCPELFSDIAGAGAVLFEVVSQLARWCTRVSPLDRPSMMMLELVLSALVRRRTLAELPGKVISRLEENWSTGDAKFLASICTHYNIRFDLSELNLDLDCVSVGGAFALLSILPHLSSTVSPKILGSIERVLSIFADDSLEFTMAMPPCYRESLKLVVEEMVKVLMHESNGEDFSSLPLRCMARNRYEVLQPEFSTLFSIRVVAGWLSIDAKVKKLSLQGQHFDSDGASALCQMLGYIDPFVFVSPS